jgi:hypothetical protein
VVDEDFCSLLLLPQLKTKYVPSAEILLTGSLPSGQDPAILCAERKERIKIRNSFFIELLYLVMDYFELLIQIKQKSKFSLIKVS